MNNTKQSRKAVFNQLQQMYEDAAMEGPEAIQSHLRDVAFSLGAQAAVSSEPVQMPEAINDLVTHFGRGIQTVIQEITGNDTELNVAVYAVNSSQH
ncbi:MAG TPA: hypothetical protein DEF35_08830 [Paenibacillus sp.]|uniref:hypothetical protein n=1 Tax=Paenibacillus TaxID=44249 RepID=UPI000BA0B605|nr:MULTISPECIES: hypothetical protein [Paenibacillus]OZQ64337.1 hypothetical protein CA599_22500 [Paenibacillus taichungensis]HBU81729.1 hypothetical protein [Paenibacillus sp.]